MKYFLPIVCAIILLSPIPSEAQRGNKGKKIRYRAETLTVGKRARERYQKLIGKVVFKQEQTTVYCDSSYYFKKRNVMEAYANVKIVDDSVTIYSDELLYDGNSRISELRKNVRYIKGDQRLYTDNLDYNLDTEVAYYFLGGKLQDPTNTLTSSTAYSYGQEDYALFYTDVVLISPEYTLRTDTLRYDLNTKIAYSEGPTIIETDDGEKLFSEGGIFRTEVDQSDFDDGQVQTEDYELEGDKLYFDDIRRYYQSVGNAVLTAKNDDVIIIGEEGYHNKNNGYSKVYGKPIMKRILEADTFYLAADTLVAIEDADESKERILAYHNVRIFKEGLQGKADSAAYFLQDSVIYLYGDPILWSDQSQITADTITLDVTEDQIKKMNLYRNSFLTSEDTLLNHNQIKGRDMEALFVENAIDFVDVDGNAESIYYALEEGDSTLMGLSKMICSSMKIEFEDSEMSLIRFYVKPEGQFFPPHKITDDVTRLPGFSWRIEERPTKADIFKASSELAAPEETPSELEEVPDPTPLPSNTSLQPRIESPTPRRELLKNVKRPQNRQ